MAPRSRPKVGNMRMDAALDAMHQLGFQRTLVRKTVQELLNVYGGSQGWPFIEETSYKLLIETLLAKQQTSASADHNEDNARRDGVGETLSALTPITGITEVDSSGLVAQETVLLATSGLDYVSKTNYQHSASQTNGQELASPGNLETDVKDLPVEAGREGHGQGIRVESKIEHKPHKTLMIQSSETFHPDTEMHKTLMIQSSEPFLPHPLRRSKGYLGWVGSDDYMENIEPHICFPLQPLSERIKKLIGQCEVSQRGSRRRLKSRWDEKPDDI